MNKRIAFILAMVVFLQTLAIAGNTATFEGLGDIDGGGRTQMVHDISADGTVVVGHGWAAFPDFSSVKGFRWTSASGAQSLNDQVRSRITGVSADGSVVVGYSILDTGHHAFRWIDLNSNGLVDPNERLNNHPEFYLDDISGDASTPAAYGVSADGSVVVGSGRTSLGHEAFRWTEEVGTVGLGDLPGGEFYSSAYAVSNDGSVVAGFSRSDQGIEACLWNLFGEIVGLGDFPGGEFRGYVLDVSDYGLVVVGESQSELGYEAFRWTEETGMVSLGNLPGSAKAVSSDGSVVVGASGNAFIWDETHGMRNFKDLLVNDYGLDLTGWTLWEASAISSNGRTIAGTGENPDGDQECWIVRLPVPVIYVDADANGLDDGSTWSDAFVYLQDALGDANSYGEFVEICVAQGTYRPIDGLVWVPEFDTREATFQLINNVTIKGGYAGAGEPNPDARDIEAYETILSGDLNGNDVDVNDPGDMWNDPSRAENSYHVVNGSETNTTAVLDGLNIIGGNANGGSEFRGGGMYNFAGNPIINNCTFTGNWASYDGLGGGGGMHNYHSNPTITNCTFNDNSAGCWGGSGGGGIYNDDSNPIIANCSFIGNYAKSNFGGGMYNTDNSSPTITGCTFTENFASGRGGAIYNGHGNSSPRLSNCIFIRNSSKEDGGGVFNYVGSNAILINCTFTGNSALENGGGVNNYYMSDPILTNCVFNENTAGEGGGGMHNSYSSSPTVTNCTFIENSSRNGGGVYNVTDGNAILTDCIFTGNSALEDGGGICNVDCNSTVIGCTFTSNLGGDNGGAISNDYVSNFELTNCTFIGNTSIDEGGAVKNYETVSTIIDCRFISNSARQGGGLYMDNEEGSTLTNCMFSGNSAEYGGGIWSEDEDVTIINCSFSENSASSEGGGVYMDENIKFSNCIFWGNVVNGSMDESAQIIVRQSVNTIISHCCVQGWSGVWGGTGNIGDDPLFVDPNGVDGIAGTIDDNLRLLPSSLCINGGTNVTDPPLPETDLDGNPRIKNGVVDMGAYEFVHKIFVGENTSGIEDGTESYPFDTIQEGIDIAHEGQVVWVLPGYYDEDITFFGENIILTGSDVNDWEVIEYTIIHGYVQFVGTEDANCKLTGFNVSDWNNGAIYGNNCHAAISHCVISFNRPCNSTVIKDCDGIISNCLITDNVLSDCGQPRPVIAGCGGLIKNCTIANNETSAILVSDNKSLTIVNTIIRSDIEPDIEVLSGATLNVSYCYFSNDSSDDIVGDGTINKGLSNSEGNPRFVNEYWQDYHLSSSGWHWSESPTHDSNWTYSYLTSACIDAGNPGSPLANELLTIPDDPNNLWGENVRINLGAYGGTAQASMPPNNWTLLGDLDNNGDIDYRDLSNQMENWLVTDAEQPGDLNRDGVVDMADFALLSSDWLQSSDNDEY